MAVQTSERGASQGTWVAEGIDLRRYIGIIFRWWREIFAITLLFVIVVGAGILGLRIALPPVYAASADVAIIRTMSDVKFDERFLTTSDGLNTDALNANTRRSALLGLVSTGAIAEEVIGELGDKLNVRERNPANLLKMVGATTTSDVGIRGDSDLIRITIQADDPLKAATIATTWAHVYVRVVNTIYGQVPDEVFASIQSELSKAQQEYLNSQKSLVAFIAENRIDALTNSVAVLQQRVNQEVTLQQALLEQWQQTQEQLTTAIALRTQVEQGGEGAVRSNMAALQVLKISVYGMPPKDLQVEVRDLPDVTSGAMITDIIGLVSSLEQRLDALTAQISRRSDQLRQSEQTATAIVSNTQLISIPVQTLDVAYQQLRESKSQLETENAHQQQLTQQRDLAWETYKALSNKVTELNLTRAAASSEVRFGAPAVAPTNPVEQNSLVLGTTLAGVVGLVIAIFATFLAEYLGHSPILVRTRQQDGK